MGLTAKRRIFIEEYLRCWNGTEAARRAGYANPNPQAGRLLAIDSIRAIIKERLAAKALTTDEVLSRLGEQARGEWTDYIIVDGATREACLDLRRMKEDGKLHLLKSITSGSRSGTKVEGYDAQAALSLIGKNLGLFPTRMQHSGPDGGPIEVAVDDSRERLAQLYNAQEDALAAEQLDSGADPEPG